MHTDNISRQMCFREKNIEIAKQNKTEKTRVREKKNWNYPE